MVNVRKLYKTEKKRKVDCWQKIHKEEHNKLEKIEERFKKEHLKYEMNFFKM